MAGIRLPEQDLDAGWRRIPLQENVSAGIQAPPCRVFRRGDRDRGEGEADTPEQKTRERALPIPSRDAGGQSRVMSPLYRFEPMRSMGHVD